VYTTLVGDGSIPCRIPVSAGLVDCVSEDDLPDVVEGMAAHVGLGHLQLLYYD